LHRTTEKQGEGDCSLHRTSTLYRTSEEVIGDGYPGHRELSSEPLHLCPLAVHRPAFLDAAATSVFSTAITFLATAAVAARAGITGGGGGNAAVVIIIFTVAAATTPPALAAAAFAIAAVASVSY
jgi:hypothetical protein